MSTRELEKVVFKTSKYYIKRGNHIHMLVEMPSKMSVSSIVWFLKGKSSLMGIIIHERHGELKYKHRNPAFWCRGYYVDTAKKQRR